MLAADTTDPCLRGGTLLGVSAPRVAFALMVAADGFEPSWPGSESGILPLDDAAAHGVGIEPTCDFRLPG